MILGAEASEFVVDRRDDAVAGEGIGAFFAKCAPPVPQTVDADPEFPRDFGDGEPPIGDRANGLEFELAGVRLPCRGVVLAESLHP